MSVKKIEDQIAGSLAKYGQIILVVAIVIVLSMMMFPMPTAMLDFFLALNIVGALTILMVAISVSDPLKLSTISTLLLLCTMFRFGLNVSSTRLILLRGEAGEIIHTFGDFVAGGNLLVGVVIFLVLMIIQFIVIAKGSERVAEVGARFTLDGMPGKQMSIDADLRAGMTTPEEAKERRDQIVREAKMYGSLDGAMKFVKGDTIAGFIITFINIAVGLIVGVFQRHMPLADAARTYTLLTIGDGLVAEIPALLVGLSAGFIVTRVSVGGEDRSLGAEIGVQILANPTALFMVAGITLLIGFIPGFPTFLFFMIAASIAGFAAFLRLKGRQQVAANNSVARHIHASSDGALGHAYPLLIELGSEMFAKFKRDKRWQNCFNHLYPQIKCQLIAETGVPFPDLKITVNPAFAPDRYRIKIYEIPVGDGFLSPEHYVIRDFNKMGVEDLTLNDGERTDHTVHGTPVLLLHLHRQEELHSRGVKTVAPEHMLIVHLGRVLKKHADKFIGIQEVRSIITNLEKHHGELVREVVPRMLSWNKLTDLVRRLVEEGIPVKDFRLILETLSGCQPDNKDIIDLTEVVRLGLKRLITYRYAPEGRIAVFHIDPEIEDEIAAGVQKTGDGNFMALPPTRLTDIQRAIRLSFRNHGATGRDAVIATRPDVRRYLRKIIESELPDVAVLSYPELAASVKLTVKDVISTNCPEVVAVR